MRTQLFTTLLLVAACTTAKEPPKAPPKLDTVKPGAPTQVEDVKLTEGGGTLTLRFDGAGENVSVRLAGIEGLTLTSGAEPLSGAPVRAGTQLPIAVSFTGRGHLVLTVQGTFNGAQQSRVHTVKVGEGLKDDGARVQVTSDGDVVKLIP